LLLVEDELDLLDLEREALTDKGYRVVTAQNGAEALERIRDEVPALILLDMRMPVMDGWTFARLVRENYGRQIPIAVVTAAEDSKLRADEIGADADLGKPFEMRELYELVEDTVGPP
jgi:DNA-binding response OmpR family regulator